MIIKILSSEVDFTRNTLEVVDFDNSTTTPSTPDTPSVTNYVFTINSTPSNATVVINGKTTKSVTVASGMQVNWSVSAEGFVTQSGTESVNRTFTKNVTLEEEVVEVVIPEEYATFASTYGRETLTDTQQTAVGSFLYKLQQKGILGKIRQLYIPCIMPDWEHGFLNVARFFNENRVEYPKVDLVSNSTLGRCFEICDYGVYRTSTEIKWGDCLTMNWQDEDVTFDNWHILAFKPAQMDATTNTHCGGLNVRSRSGATTPLNFSIGGANSATERVRGGWASGTVTVDGTGIPIKDSLFTFPIGWGNGTHDPYCVGLSIKDSKMMTPSSNYQEFGYNNRNLVNQIDEMPLVEGAVLPTTPLTGTYGWGGYYGASISTQQSLATSIVSIGLGLTATEIQDYMDIADEFMEILGIKNNNWDPDNLSNVA